MKYSSIIIGFFLVWFSGCGPSLPSTSQIKETVRFDEIGTFTGNGGVSAMEFFAAHNDRLVMTASMDGRIKALQIDSMQELWSTRLNAVLDAIAFSPDGKHAAVVGNRNTIVLIESSAGKVIREFIGHAGSIRSVAFSSNGEYLATGSSDGTIILWDVETAEDIHLFPEWSGSAVNSLVFSKDGLKLAAGINEELAVYDLRNYTKIKSIFLADFWIEKMKFSPDMEYVALIDGSKNSATLLDMETEQIVAEFEGHEGSVRSIDFSADYSKLITGGHDATVRIWDILSHKQIGKIDGFDYWVTATSLSRDGKRLLVADLGQKTFVYEITP